MDARELRIGNKLRYNETIVVVLEIKRGNKVELGYFEDSIGFERDLSEVEPVLITEEILWWFGFKIDGVWCYLDFEPRMQIRFYGGNSAECDIVQDGKFIAFKNGHIKYVHQLQNLIYALTGKN